ncbi:MAG: alpha/beta fold hydrolase [Promethearchaeota archaeon]|jgi:proline-specific peptidase
MSEEFAEVNGINICYEIHGKGYPIILVHGFGNKKEHWRAQVEDLSNYFKVIRFDNRGAGKSERPDGPYSMELYADDINALMDYLEIEKAHIIGHSLGGMIVQNFILKYPHRTNKVILINTLSGITLPGVPNEKGIEMYRTNAITSLKELMKDPINKFLESAKRSYSRSFWKLMVDNPKKKFHGIWSVEDLVQEKLDNPTTVKDINNQVEALKTHSVYEKLHLIKNEVLILAAEKDKTCTTTMNEKTHELIPNSKLIIIEKAAHQSILEKAPEVNKLIIEFLKS